ncbi:alpha/beta-hydrolase [Poronia punctata]|nr:alpha/beta-hydrolase [Poronia punctata]
MENPNALHDSYIAKNGPKDVPDKVVMEETDAKPSAAKDPGHPYAQTRHISFSFFDQRKSNAPFGYEHYVSLPPAYETEEQQKPWPLILFLHGAGESQRGRNESYLSIRHGIPKVILCYDKMKSNQSQTQNSDPDSEQELYRPDKPSISIPRAERLRKVKGTTGEPGDKSGDPVLPETCELLAENFITVTPSLNMEYGYGWNASILSALLDEIVDRYRVDLDRIHVTGFSMGGYGTWDLAMHSPHRFASIMPICGGGDPLRVSHIKHIPHWVHHGDLDDTIPLKASKQMVEALERAGADNVQFTRYPDLSHDSWTAAYGNPVVYKWMLYTRRHVKGDEHVVPEGNKVTVG